MVVDRDKRFGGTGFFYQKECCITCHHNIAGMSEIMVGRNGIFYDAEWIEENSDAERDISVLRVAGSIFEPLECINKILPGLCQHTIINWK